MNTLISIRHNTVYLKTNNDSGELPEFNRHEEIILLVDKPEYSLNNEHEVIRTRGVDELRFSADEKTLDSLITALSAIRDKE